MLTVLSSKLLYSLLAAGAGAVVWKIKDMILVDLVARFAPRLFLQCFGSLLVRVNVFFEKKKKNSKMSGTWAELERQVVDALRKSADEIEK